jgi:hypothetical protein
MRFSTNTKRWRRLLAMAGASAIAALAIAVPVRSASASSPGPDTVGGLAPGTIQHVWLIILENKSYDETFTGLNSNSYLWQTLPSEGVLLEELLRHRPHQPGQLHRPGLRTGPRSPTPRTTAATIDTPFGSNSTITTTGAVGGDSPNWTYGQVVSHTRGHRPLRLQQSARVPPPSIDQRLHLPDGGPDPVRPVQRGRRELEGLRPGPGRRPAHRIHLVRVRQRARP